METSCVPKPTDEKTSVVTFELTVILKVPSVPDEVPIVLPFAVTETPGKPDPSFESVTFPVIVLSCAKFVIEIKRRQGKTIALSNLSQYISSS
jgi:hypothetical protein